MACPKGVPLWIYRSACAAYLGMPKLTILRVMGVSENMGP